MAATDKAKDFDWAVKNGDLAGVRVFVEKDGVNPASLKDANSRGPIHWASDYVRPFSPLPLLFSFSHLFLILVPFVFLVIYPPSLLSFLFIIKESIGNIAIPCRQKRC
jgi:hypothetical protein